MAVRKGFLLSLDALFASILIISALLLYLQIGSTATDNSQSQLYGQDVLLSLGKLTLGEIQTDEPWVTALYAETVLESDDSLIYSLGLLWVIDDARLSNLSRIVNDTVPAGVGLRIDIEDEVIFQRSGNRTEAVVAASRQQITGIDKGKPVAGSSASAYLKRLKDKQTAAFGYFGGFVGQGNITVKLDLPVIDFNDVLALDMELDIPRDFELYINAIHCGDFVNSTGNKTPDTWNLTDCIPSLVSGNNTFEIYFDSLEEAYVAGGVIRAAYKTDEFVTDTNINVTRYDFPDIRGVANLFDGFTVPSTLRHMDIRLHYENSDPDVITYLTVGEKTVWESSDSGSVDIMLDDSNLTMLDYDQLSNRTVPVRFASFNATTKTITGGEADVILVTDYSGSMKKDIDDDSQGRSQPVTDCEGKVYVDPDIRRTHLARCLDKEVIDILFNESLNLSGNRLWPVHFHKNGVEWYNNPEDPEALRGFYESYSGSFPQQGTDQTCLACALSQAYDILDTYTNSSRKAFVILMSDGLPTHCTGAGCGGRDTSYAGTETCEGYCDVSGQSCSGTVEFCTNSQCAPAMQNTEIVAQDLVDDFNATIFTVGLGPVSDCDNATQLLQSVADIGNGTFQNSSDIDALKAIYRNISYSILDVLELEAQEVIIAGNITESILFGDSFIRLEHDEPTNPPQQNEIEVTRQTPQLGACSTSFSLPTGVRYKQADLVSYSGSDWTDLVTVNGNTALNLSEFLVPYYRLGDPYRIGLPANSLGTSNTIFIRTAEDSSTYTTCSDNNSIIYTAYVPSATARTPVLENATGCIWTIESEEAGTQVITVPSSYSGGNTCSYTNALIDYDSQDTMQVAVFQLLEKLDFDSDGRIFVSLVEEDLEIIITKVSTIPYLWGPVVMTAEVRQ